MFPFDTNEKLLTEQSISTPNLQHKNIYWEGHRLAFMRKNGKKKGTEIIPTLPFFLSRPFSMAFPWHTKMRGYSWIEQGGQEWLTGTARCEHPTRNTWHLMSTLSNLLFRPIQRVLQESKGLRKRKTERHTMKWEGKGSKQHVSLVTGVLLLTKAYSSF